jgi:hypothetical protein
MIGAFLRYPSPATRGSVRAADRRCVEASYFLAHRDFGRTKPPSITT